MRTKFILSFLMSLLISVISGVLIGTAVGLPIVGISAALFGASFIPTPQGLKASVYTEIWTGELLKKFRTTPTFLSTIQRRDDLVNNNVIHMVDVGADPMVLINNITYPIAIASRSDSDVAISLDKFDTTNTKVTRDELYALSYDKMSNVIEQHKEVMDEKTADKALHSLAPSVASAGSPLILTTGASNAATNARKRLTIKEIVMAKRNLDDLKIPKQGRVLVLCNQHIEDLLLVDEVFAKQYKDIQQGQVLRLYGFDIHEYATNPLYKVVATVLTKAAFGIAAAPTTDQDASVFYYSPRAFQATGTVEMFYKDAFTNPEYRESVVGFRVWHICLPKKTEGFGAIVSAIV